MKVIKLLSTIIAIGALACALTACGDDKQAEQKPEQNQVQEDVNTSNEEVQKNSEEANTPTEETQENNYSGIANPIVEYDSVEDAVIQVGHLSPLPAIYERYNKKAQVISNTLIEIIYSDDQGEVLRIREERRPSGDISGNYNSFAYTNTIQINENDVTLNGDSEDSISLVTWNDGAFSHSINYAEGHSLEEVTAVVTEING